MHQSFPKQAPGDQEFENVVGTFIIYLFQGARVLIKFWENKIYFGDCKPENFLVSFRGRRFIIGDFGIAMQMSFSYNNYGRGCTPMWSLPSVVKCI